MNKFIGIVFVFGFLTACNNNSLEPSDELCAQFKEGTFKYVGNEDVRVERNLKEQIEYNISGEGGYVYTDYYYITWVSDCEYYLTLKSTDHPNDLDFSATDTMWVKINQIYRKGYSFVAVKGNKTFEGEFKRTAI